MYNVTSMLGLLIKGDDKPSVLWLQYGTYLLGLIVYQISPLCTTNAVWCHNFAIVYLQPSVVLKLNKSYSFDDLSSYISASLSSFGLGVLFCPCFFSGLHFV